MEGEIADVVLAAEVFETESYDLVYWDHIIQ